MKILASALLCCVITGCTTETAKNKPATTIPADYITSLQPPVTLGEESIILDGPYEGFQGVSLIDATWKKIWIYWDSRKTTALLLGKINSTDVKTREIDYGGKEGSYLLYILNDPGNANDPDVRLITDRIKKKAGR